MGFSTERGDAIIRTIVDRVPSLGRGKCSLCQKRKGFVLAPGYVHVPLDKSPLERHVLPGPQAGMPSVALVCNHCGVTLLFNLTRLGLLDVVPEPQGEPQ